MNDVDREVPPLAPHLTGWEGWQRYRLLYALALLLLFGVGWAALSASGQLRNTLAEIMRLQEATKQMSALMQMTVDLESGQRGYLLTGDDQYLEPYAAAEVAVDQKLADVDTALRDYPDSRAELAAIREMLRKKRGELAATLTLYRQQGPQAALDLVRSDYGREATDDIRQAIARLSADVREILQARQVDIGRTIATRNVAIFTTLGLAIAAGVASLVLLRRHLRALRQEEQLRRQKDDADRANREKSVFLANMSHEIRTPMNAIFGFGQLLAERVTDPQDRRYVDAIVTSGRSLLALINDVLDLSRVEAGRLEIRPQPTNLRDLVEGAVALFAQLAADKRLRLVTQIDPALPEALELDPGRLRQVLFNLIGNAIKYTDAGQVTVRVATRPEADDETRMRLVVDVEDTGQGIAVADRERIFDPFVQASRQGEVAREGSGLGLSITRRLVRLMGGDILLDSIPGKGSRFRVRLPRVPLAPPPEADLPATALTQLPPGTVLVVDDMPLNRSLIEAMLRGSATTVLQAEDGERGVAMAHHHKPHVVLMDIRMPGIDGVTALARLRADPSLAATRVVALSASNLADDEAAQRRLFDGYLRKPVSRQALFAELLRLLPARTPAAPDGERAMHLAAELAALESDAWPALRATLAARDCARFASHLAELADAAGADALGDYARQLRAAADSVDPLALEAALADFPRLRARLAASTEST